MPAATAMAGASVAMSAAANARAQEAKKVACTDMVENYQGSAVVETQKQYAECVGILHPEPVNAQGVLAGKALVAAMFIGILIGLIAAARNSEYDDGARWFYFPFMGGVGLPLFLAVLGLLVAAAQFLFQ